MRGIQKEKDRELFVLCLFLWWKNYIEAALRSFASQIFAFYVGPALPAASAVIDDGSLSPVHPAKQEKSNRV